jgi:predicted phage terminase large subunit-like protein
MTTSTEEIKILKVAHVLCKDDFLFYTRYFFKQQYRRRWAQWDHLIQIADVLKKVLTGEITRLIINIAPRYGKTELAVKSFISYGLAINPAAKFIHLSYSDDLALDNSETARDWVQSAEYQRLFPSVRVKKNSDSKKKWYTEAGGGVYATSTGGQITGFGAGVVDPAEEAEDLGEEVAEVDQIISNHWLGEKARFGGAIIIDDPNKPDDADSETLRNRVNERYDSTISNRVNSRRTPIIIIQQRTHEDDLSGYLIRKQGKAEERGLWHVLSLPSIKEDGTALCPQKHTIDELRALEKHNDLVFQRQHMQNPKPKSGLLFPIQDLQFYDPVAMEEKLSDPDFCYICADPAGEGGDDFAAGPFKLIGDKIYVTDIIYNTEGADHNEALLEALILNHNAKSVGVESIFGWEETAKRVRTALWEQGFKNEFRNLRPRTNKHTRILNRSSFIRNNFVFRKDWDTLPQYAKFIRNLTSYMKIQEPGRKNKHDDAPDLCEMAAVYYERNFAHLFALPKK